jgi:putative peptidoglycan lipid II flippase
LGGVLLATRGLAAAKDVVVSQTFGTSIELDAFLVAFGVMTFLASVVSNAGTSTLVPALSRARNDPEPGAEGRLIVVAASTAVVLCSFLIAVVLLFRVQLSLWVAPGFDAERILAVQSLLIALAPVPLLGTLQSIIASTLNARYGFRGAAAITAITPLCVAASLLLRSHPTAGDLATGTILGMMLEVVCLIILTHRRKISLFVAVPWSVAARSVYGLGRDFLPLVAGTALGSTAPLVDQAFASAVGPGSIATLSYANRITALGMGIGISSIGLIALPHFSELAAREAWIEMGTLLRKLAAATFLLALPVALVICVLSEPLIRVLFERGRFVSADTATVASVQTLYALQIPFHLTGIVGVRALNAMRKNRIIMLVVIWNVVSNVAGDYVFLELFGLRGIALATSVTYMVSCAAILTFAGMELGRRARLLTLEKS